MIRQTQYLAILLIANLVLSACAGSAPSNSTVRSGGEVIPTPASSLIGNFVWQTDGLFGYRMLRPTNWEPVNSVDAREYGTPSFQSAADRIVLRAINLKAYYKSATSANGLIAQLALFEQDSSLDGWTKGIEQMWKSDGLESTLLRTLPQARIYSVTSPGSSDVQLVAYAVDQNQPLAISLTASGAYADMDRLQKEGILEDFAMMVASIQAIPQDPQNVDPPLAAAPTPTAIPAISPTAAGDLSWLPVRVQDIANSFISGKAHDIANSF